MSCRHCHFFDSLSPLCQFKAGFLFKLKIFMFYPAFLAAL